MVGCMSICSSPCSEHILMFNLCPFGSLRGVTELVLNLQPLVTEQRTVRWSHSTNVTDRQALKMKALQFTRLHWFYSICLPGASVWPSFSYALEIVVWHHWMGECLWDHILWPVMLQKPLNLKANGNRVLFFSFLFATTELSGRSITEKVNDAVRGICIPWTLREVDHNGTKVVFSNWILSAEQVGKLHCGQNSTALQSLLLEWKLQLYKSLEHLACPVILATINILMYQAEKQKRHINHVEDVAMPWWQSNSRMLLVTMDLDWRGALEFLLEHFQQVYRKQQTRSTPSMAHHNLLQNHGATLQEGNI